MSTLDNEQKQFIGLLGKQFGVPSGEAAAKALDIAMSVPLGLKLRPAGAKARISMEELGFSSTPNDTNDKVTGLESERDALKARVVELESDVSRVSDQVSSRDQEISGLRSLISDLNDEIERLKLSAVESPVIPESPAILILPEPTDEVITLRERVANLEAEIEQMRTAAPARERKAREPRAPKAPREPRAPKAPKPVREDGMRVRSPNEAPLTSITINGDVTETKNWRGGLVAIGTYLVRNKVVEQLPESYFPREASKYTTTFEVDGVSYYAYTNLAAEGIRKRMNSLRDKFSLEISYTVRE